MNNIIVGTGLFARKIAEIFENNRFKIDLFVNISQYGKSLPTTLRGIPVVPIENIPLSVFEKNNWIIAKKPMFIESAIDFLRKKEAKNIYVINEEIFFEHDLTRERIILYLDKIDFKVPFLNYLETNVVDYCNLNCKGCAHFSNICTKEAYLDLKEYKSDLKLICQNFNVYCFRLLGGEPLLHPNIGEVIRITRYYLPCSRLFLVTNGLKIQQLKQEILDIIRENRIIITISVYKKNQNQMNNIINILKENSIMYLINDDYFSDGHVIEYFNKRLMLSKKIKDDYKNLTCGGRFCKFLRNGKISKCYYPLLIEILNNHFNIHFEVSENDYIDLKKITNAWEEIEKMKRKIPFCDYCHIDDEKFQWDTASSSKAKIGDYIIEDKNNYIYKK